MAIDPSIALGVKPVQITSQEDYLKDIYAMQNAQQANQLNRMKMDEYTKGIAQDEAIRNDLANAKSSEDVVNTLNKYGKTKEAAEYAYRTAETGKVGAEAKNLGYTGEKTQLESAHKRLDIMGQAFGYVRNNPTPQAAGMALKHLRDSGVIDDAKANELWQQVMADPTKIKDMADMAFTSTLQAKDQLPKFISQNLGGTVREIGVNPITGVTTVAPGSEAKVTATPGELITKDTTERGQNMTAATALAGQNLTKRGQDLTDARDLQRIAIEKGKTSPEYIAMKANQEEKGKIQAKFEAAAPQAITTAEQMLTKIDELVGKKAVVDEATGKVTPGTAAHEGFKAAVGKTSLFPTMPGSKASDFETRLDEIKGGAFLEAYNTLRGGGSITEVEGKKATAARTRMSTAQSEKEFIKAARDYQEIIRAGIKDAKEKLAKGVSAPATTPAGATVSNW